MIFDVLMYLGIATGYYIFSASVTLLLKKIANPSTELWRKMLHLIAVNFVFVLLNIFPTWDMAVIVVFSFMAVVYLILTLIEHLPQYSKVLAERKNGEIKSSLILVFMMFIILTAIFWGYMGTSWKYVIMVAVLAWGYGDASAALAGKRYGRHYLEHRMIEGKKTIEGTLVMFAVSVLTIFVTTTIFARLSLQICLLVALGVAPVCAIVELFSRSGSDTITVPCSAAFATFVIMSALMPLGA